MMFFSFSLIFILLNKYSRKKPTITIFFRNTHIRYFISAASLFATITTTAKIASRAPYECMRVFFLYIFCVLTWFIIYHLLLLLLLSTIFILYRYFIWFLFDSLSFFIQSQSNDFVCESRRERESAFNQIKITFVQWKKHSMFNTVININQYQINIVYLTKRTKKSTLSTAASIRSERVSKKVFAR